MNCSLQARVLLSILTYLRVRFQGRTETSDSSLLQEEALVFPTFPCPFSSCTAQFLISYFRRNRHWDFFFPPAKSERELTTFFCLINTAQL